MSANPIMSLSADQLMSARDRVTQTAEVLSQIQFHLQGGFVRHRVQVGIEFGQQVDAVALHEGR